jgi:hypothetical protein
MTHPCQARAAKQQQQSGRQTITSFDTMFSTASSEQQHPKVSAHPAAFICGFFVLFAEPCVWSNAPTLLRRAPQLPK